MPKLIRSKYNRIMHLPCVVCDSWDATTRYTYHHDRQSSNILQCASCTHMFIHPVPLTSLSSRNMHSLSDAELFQNQFLKFLYEKLVINKEIRHVKKLITNPRPSLLDIGCGTGWTTSIWQKSGFSVTGLEPSENRSLFGQNIYGINIVRSCFEDYQPGEQFDVIILRHILEHISDPCTFLTRIKSFLKKDGVLVIVIPNIDSIGRYLFNENWEWVLPWHLHFYKPKTLSRLIQKVCYKILRFYQMPSPLWYPASLSRFFGRETRLARFLSQKPTLANLALFTPIILAGILLDLNDHMTLIVANHDSTK